jgi:hypothetical protein
MIAALAGNMATGDGADLAGHRAGAAAGGGICECSPADGWAQAATPGPAALVPGRAGDEDQRSNPPSGRISSALPSAACAPGMFVAAE